MRIIKQVLVTWSRLEYVTNLNYFVSTTTVPMATNFYSIVTNFEQLLAMFLHPLVYPLVTWSCKIIWQIKNIFSLLPQCLWPPQCLWLTLHQTGQGWLTMRGFCPQSHMNLESGDLTWKNKKHISTTIMPMAIKLCRRLLFITSHDHILRRSCKIAWQWISLYIHYHNAWGFCAFVQVTSDDLLWEASIHKITQPSEHVVTLGQMINQKHLHYHNA